MNSQNELKGFQDALLSWFESNQRILAFRETKNPYYIWVSEVMLQQTRVAAMLPSYNRFIKKFPDINTLANSTEQEVLALWKGLGYYSRALNLRKAAIYLEENHSGIFPKNIEEVLKIPGIGPYTARAVLSIAYDLPHAVLDGNVKRVLSRIFLYEKNISTSSAHKDLQILADNFLNPKSPGNHNQAMMELGASLCSPTPNCSNCPLLGLCKAYKLGKQQALPVVEKEKAKLQIQMHFLILNKEKEVLLVKDNKRRFFKKIFSLPFWIEGENLGSEYKAMYPFINKNMISDTKKLPSKHSITHHEIEVFIHTSSRFEDFHVLNELDHKFIPIESLEENFPSSLSRKIMRFLGRDFLPF